MKIRTLIVGGSSGIGYAVAQQLLQQGQAVTIVGRSPAKLANAVAELAAIGDVQSQQCDLYDAAQVADLAQSIENSGIHFAELVNAAGYFNPLPFLQHSRADYDIYMELNRAIFEVSQAAARNMIRHGGGAIVQIGSMWAKQAIKATPSSAYSMAKAGLHALTQHMAMELAEHNIRVNAVSPAVVKTPIYEAFIEAEEVDAALQAFNNFHPIGRIGNPGDIAATVCHLLSAQAAWVTGAMTI